MDIARFALAIIVALTMMVVFFLLVNNDLNEIFNNRDLKSKATIRKNRSLRRNKKSN